jgi:hypothetical protein
MYAYTGDIENETTEKSDIDDSKEFEHGHIDVQFFDQSKQYSTTPNTEYSINLKALHIATKDIVGKKTEFSHSPCCHKDSTEDTSGPYGVDASFIVGGIGKPTDTKLTGQAMWKEGNVVWKVEWNLHK